MAFDGSGTFNRPVASYVFDTVISETSVNAEMDGISVGLSNCITRDGQSVPTANLPMASFRHTGVADATARTNYASGGQLQDGTINWVVAGGTADALTASYTPILTALVDGQLCFVRAASANATTTPTFAPNGLTAHTITKQGGGAVAVGQWVTDQEVVLRYKLASTRWEIVNPTLTGTQIKPLLSGMPTQQVFTETGEVATGSTLFPADDTIPQITEGDQYMSLAITPTSSTSSLVIEIVAVVAASGAGIVTGALFQDSNANAIAAAWERVDTAGQPVCLCFRHKMAAGTTSATTFKLRLGPNTGVTLTFNGTGGARIYGGVMASSMRITEILP